MGGQSIPDPGIAVRIASATLVATLVIVASAGAAPAGVPLGPPSDLLAVPNGDLLSGLVGWGVMGPATSMVLADGPVISASDNTTVLGPVVAIPQGAQVIPVSIGVPGANAFVQVRARPEGGGPDIPLITLVPDRGVRSMDVPVGAVAGQTVRIVLDPVSSVGRRLLVGGMGPVRAVLPGWSVSAGLPVIARSWGRSAIRVDDGMLTATTPAVALGGASRYLGVAVRGSGTVVASAGGAQTRLTASDGAWTWLHVRVAGAGQRMSLRATTTEGGVLALGPVATPAQRVSLSALRASAGRVTAKVGPLATGLRVQVRVGARIVGTARVAPSGMVSIATSGAGGRGSVVVLGDASRAGITRAIRLTG